MKEDKRYFFCKKSTKKTFIRLGPGGFSAMGPESKKFFASFFQKRSLLLLLFLPLALMSCGRRGAPTPPGPASEITYPHVYPAE